MNLLEKRVKSRFSHRIIRCSPPTDHLQYLALAEAILKSTIGFEKTSAPEDMVDDEEHVGQEPLSDEWRTAWNRSIDVSRHCSHCWHFDVTFVLCVGAANDA